MNNNKYAQIRQRASAARSRLKVNCLVATTKWVEDAFKEVQRHVLNQRMSSECSARTDSGRVIVAGYVALVQPWCAGWRLLASPDSAQYSTATGITDTATLVDLSRNDPPNVDFRSQSDESLARAQSSSLSNFFSISPYAMSDYWVIFSGVGCVACCLGVIDSWFDSCEAWSSFPSLTVISIPPMSCFCSPLASQNILRIPSRQ